jgi:hypothetical protein
MLATSGRNAVFYTYISTGKTIHGIVVGRDIEQLKTFKERIEAGLRIAGQRTKDTLLTEIEMLVEKTAEDRKIMDACRLIRNKDMLYLPVNIVPRANVARILPPSFYQLNLVQLVGEFYSQCKIDSLLESALICDLSLHSMGDAQAQRANYLP